MAQAVAYIRISQEDENPENQKLAILEWAKKHGVEVAGFFIDTDISGIVPPRNRPKYKAMLDFAKDNGIKLILFYDLSRLSRNLEEGLIELKKLTEEGFDFKFIAQEFLDYISDPMLRKKVISDFLWFAELYREDIVRRTKQAMSRLKKEGRIYHRPRLIHYIALYLSGKNSFNELTREDVENAKKYMKNMLKTYIELKVPLYKIHQLVLERLHDMYSKYPKAPKSYDAIKRLLEDIEIHT